MIKTRLILLTMSLTAAAAMGACPDSWTSLDNRCYKTSTDAMTWFTAQQWCYDNGGYLAEITSDVEQAALFLILDPAAYHWIGLTDLAYEGTWIWQHSHEESSYTSWGTNAPDNAYDGEDCAHIYPGALEWNDISCEKSYNNDDPFYALCETDSF